MHARVTSECQLQGHFSSDQPRRWVASAIRGADAKSEHVPRPRGTHGCTWGARVTRVARFFVFVPHRPAHRLQCEKATFESRTGPTSFDAWSSTRGLAAWTLGLHPRMQDGHAGLATTLFGRHPGGWAGSGVQEQGHSGGHVWFSARGPHECRHYSPSWCWQGEG